MPKNTSILHATGLITMSDLCLIERSFRPYRGDDIFEMTPTHGSAATAACRGLKAQAPTGADLPFPNFRKDMFCRTSVDLRSTAKLDTDRPRATAKNFWLLASGFFH